MSKFDWKGFAMGALGIGGCIAKGVYDHYTNKQKAEKVEAERAKKTEEQFNKLWNSKFPTETEGDN